MSTKLTLTIDGRVIEKAKSYARKQERSLSDLIENYLKAITSEESTVAENLPPMVQALRGSFKAPSDFDYKKELADRLTEKYLSAKDSH